MKRTLATLAIAAAVLMASTTVFAQDSPNQDRREQRRGPGGPGPGGRGPGGMGMMRDLNLTDDQKAQVEQFRKTEREKMEALDKQALTREQYRDQSMAIRTDTQKQIESILTSDQKA